MNISHLCYDKPSGIQYDDKRQMIHFSVRATYVTVKISNITNTYCFIMLQANDK